MGLLTDILIASPEEAKAICAAEGRHGQQWPCLEYKRVDNMKLAALGEALGVGGAALEGEDRLVFMASKGGPWVFHIPEELRDALADLLGR